MGSLLSFRSFRRDGAVAAVLEPPERRVALEKRLPQTRAISAPLADVDDEKRTIRFVAVTEQPDMQWGDIIRVKGIQIDPKNPGSFLWCHRRDMDPRGVIEKFEKGAFKGEPVLFGDVHFPDDDPDAEKTFRQYQNGMLRMVSFGWLPLLVKRVEDQKEREKLGLGPFGVIYEKVRALELSAVNVAADPGCMAVGLRTMLNLGLIAPDEEQRAELLMRQQRAHESEGLTVDQAEEIVSAIRELSQQVQELRGSQDRGSGGAPTRALDAGLERDLYDALLSVKQGIESIHVDAPHGASAVRSRRSGAA